MPIHDSNFIGLYYTRSSDSPKFQIPILEQYSIFSPYLQLIMYYYKIHVMNKNESMTPTCSVNLLTTAFEMFSKYNIIKLPSNADYEFEKILNVLLHAATSTSNSLESA